MEIKQNQNPITPVSLNSSWKKLNINNCLETPASVLGFLWIIKGRQRQIEVIDRVQRNQPCVDLRQGNGTIEHKVIDCLAQWCLKKWMVTSQWTKSINFCFFQGAASIFDRSSKTSLRCWPRFFSPITSDTIHQRTRTYKSPGIRYNSLMCKPGNSFEVGLDLLNGTWSRFHLFIIRHGGQATCGGPGYRQSEAKQLFK